MVDKVGAPYRVLLYQPSIRFIFLTSSKVLSLQHYHPEDDEQTEYMNQTLEQYLHVYCNYQQDNWSKPLPLAEFVYNNTPSATAIVFPFFVNKRYHPNIIVHPECDIASSRACDFTVDLDELQSILKSLWSNSVIRNLLMHDILPLLISK